MDEVAAAMAEDRASNSNCGANLTGGQGQIIPAYFPTRVCISCSQLQQKRLVRAATGGFWEVGSFWW